MFPHAPSFSYSHALMSPSFIRSSSLHLLSPHVLMFSCSRVFIFSCSLVSPCSYVLVFTCFFSVFYSNHGILPVIMTSLYSINEDLKSWFCLPFFQIYAFFLLSKPHPRLQNFKGVETWFHNSSGGGAMWPPHSMGCVSTHSMCYIALLICFFCATIAQN